jgi:hypothetical protein
VLYQVTQEIVSLVKLEGRAQRHDIDFVQILVGLRESEVNRGETGSDQDLIDGRVSGVSRRGIPRAPRASGCPLRLSPCSLQVEIKQLEDLAVVFAVGADAHRLRHHLFQECNID